MFINRRLHSWQANGVARRYLIRYMSYLLMVALVALATLLPLYTTGVINFGISISWLMILVCGSLLFNSASQTAIPLLNLLGESGRYMLLSVATIAASFACATLLVQLVQPLAQYWLLGLLAGQTLVGVIGIKVLFGLLNKPAAASDHPPISRLHQQSLYKYAWPVAIAAGLGWLQGQGYRYLMENQLGLAQLGLFVAGYGISAGMIAGFESVLTTYFQPRLYRDASSDIPSKQVLAWRHYAAAVIPSLLLTVVFIVLLAPELTRIFLGDSFQSAADYVIWGALAEMARVLTGIYSMIAHVHMRTRWLILPNSIGAVLSVVLCALLIPYFGAEGAGIGLVTAGFAVVASMHVLLARHAGGGTPVRFFLRTGIFAAVLWGLTLSIRYMFDETDWRVIVCVTMLIGIAFVGLQYALLRRYLEKREA